MAKKDELLARIDADIAKLKDIETYAQTHGDNQALLSLITADLTELQKMRYYVTGDGAAAEPKARKPRKKKGLPENDGI